MGCIECEVPAAVTRGRGGERTLEREREIGEAGRESKGGIWRSADYAEQTQQLAEKAKTFTNHRGGQIERGGGKERKGERGEWAILGKMKEGRIKVGEERIAPERL